MKLKISEIAAALEDLAPRAYQENYDNTGLIVGDPAGMTGKILITLDVTEEVVREAEKEGADLIISHHPPLFSGLKRLTGSNDMERALIRAIRGNISLYAIHTNLDNMYNGVNDILSSKIGLNGTSVLRRTTGNLKKLVTFCPTEHADKVRNTILEAGAGHIGNYDFCSYNLEGTGSFRAGEGTDPYVGKKNEVHFEKEMRIESIFPHHLQNRILSAMHAAHPYEEVAFDIYPLDNEDPRVGSGMVGTLGSPLVEKEFLSHLKSVLGLTAIKHSPLTGKKVSKVAVCGGSGSFLITDAIRAGADAFVTADMKYHQYFEADGKILLVDGGHYETEQFTKELLFSYLKEKFSNFALLISKVNTNPIKYL